MCVDCCERVIELAMKGQAMVEETRGGSAEGVRQLVRSEVVRVELVVGSRLVEELRIDMLHISICIWPLIPSSNAPRFTGLAPISTLVCSFLSWASRRSSFSWIARYFACRRAISAAS